MEMKEDKIKGKISILLKNITIKSIG